MHTKQNPLIGYLNNPNLDEQIKGALIDAKNKNELSFLAEKIGIAGGVGSLEKIIQSNKEISIIDKGMLGLYFGFIEV